MLTCTSFQGMKREHIGSKVNNDTVECFQGRSLVERGESSEIFEEGRVGEK